MLILRPLVGSLPDVFPKFSWQETAGQRIAGAHSVDA